MESIVCNLCGSQEHSLIYEKPDSKFFPQRFFKVVECNRCGLGFVNPRPTFQEIWEHYPKTYYDDFGSKANLRRYAIQASYLRAIEEALGHHRLLDVGCANGDFPRYMRSRGWQVEGVEASPASLQINDFTVYRVPFPDMPVCEGRFDAVTAWAVLEHVHDPAAWFRKAGQVLRPGGLFVFLVTNFDSLGSRYLFQEDVPRHLYFFTEQTVKAYLVKAGLVFERSDYTNKIYSMRPRFWSYYLAKRLIRRRFTWPLPTDYDDFLREHDMKRGSVSLVKYCLRSPMSALDYALLPLVERVQILRRTYGIVVYVGRKLE
jgi:SAM-dependent methyltransferase